MSFSVGIAELGGYPLVIDAHASQLGRGEPIEDTTRVLDRQVAAIVWRTFAQARIEAMARVSRVPVVNALTDEFHPCQVLADLQTIRERHGTLAGVTLSYVGDAANNMAHSYLLGGATAGLHVRVAGPAGYLPDPRRRRGRRAGRRDDRRLGARHDGRRPLRSTEPTSSRPTPGCRWARRTRRTSASRPFAPFAITRKGPGGCAPDAIVLHCLPAYRGREIAAEVIDGPRSAVWDEAENRLHAQKALLTWLLEQT